MHKPVKLNSIWLKASVLGCLWASSEIVLGSFLHNIRAPFTGPILTSIEIILLISVTRFWKEKGLIWRSGLVCALMKAISPSAVILGPMIAILSQAFLIEASFRFLGKNVFAAMLGGIMAMSWNLVQLTLNYLIIYGTGMIDIYVNLTKFAQKQLKFNTGGYWTPLLLLLSVYVIFGVFSSLMGYFIGKKAAASERKMTGISVKQVEKIKSTPHEKKFPHSISWLVADFILLAGVMALMNFTQPVYWVCAGVFIVLLWAFRYKGSLRRLAKPAFWITFVIITFLTSVLFIEFNNEGNDLSKGIMAGLQMNFRAAIMIVGFSALSTELGNQKIRDFFLRSWFRQLPLALEVAFDALPQVIANLPKLTDVFKKPVSVMLQLVVQAEFWLEQVSIKLINREHVILIEGSKGDGKTSFLVSLIKLLEEKNIKVAGILAPAYIENDSHCGYDLVDIRTKKRMELCRISGRPDMPLVGHYYFNTDTLKKGRDILYPENCKNADLIIVDEVGPWELENQGWAANLNLLVKNLDLPMVWIVRKGITEKVIDKWSLKNARAFDVKKITPDDVLPELLKTLSFNF